MLWDAIAWRPDSKRHSTMVRLFGEAGVIQPFISLVKDLSYCLQCWQLRFVSVDPISLACPGQLGWFCTSPGVKTSHRGRASRSSFPFPP